MVNDRFNKKTIKLAKSILKLNVRKKLLGAFLIVLLFLGGIGILASVGIKTVNNSYTTLLREQVATVEKIKDLKLEVMTHSDSVRGFLITGDAFYLYDFDMSVERFDKIVKDIESSNATEKTKKMVKNLDRIQEDYQLNVQQQIELKQAYKTDEYLMMMKTNAKEIGVEFNKQANELIKYENDLLKKQNRETAALTEKIRILIVFIGIAAFIVGIMLAFFISGAISNPIIKASQAIKRIASGDLTLDEISIRNRDEIGDLVHSLNQMIIDLRVVLGQVNNSSSQVASSSEKLAAIAEENALTAGQVAQIAQRNSHGMEEQLHYFNNVIATVQELSSGIIQISNNSEQMLEATEKATNITTQGTKFVENVVKQMNHIYKSVSQATSSIQSLEKRSREISTILGMIKGIADQTNLLALNAAIEAARAGEHGKGFAVVADEVRSLAEESKKSAEQITNMVLEIQRETQKAVQAMEAGNHQVTEGLGDTEKANAAFKNISLSIEGVVDRVQNVASSVEELSSASEQISESVSQVKEISVRSAAGGQESAAASEEQLATIEEVSSSAESLSKLAEDLKSVISRFKI